MQRYRSRRVMYTDEVCKRLPYAFVWSLYHPLLDTSITRNTTNDKTTFSITLSDGARYDNLELGFTGSVPGRQTTIFFKPDDSCTVIKEQYIDSDRRFFEGSILKIIHASGDFPGFVRLKWSEYVKNGGQRLAVSKRSTTRFKTRLVIQDKGTPLDSVKTVRELLMILYDVLEVTRILHRTWHIIHRDISPGNILVTDSARSFPNTSQTSDLSFSESIIKPGSEPTRTRLLLADFEFAEDKRYEEGQSRTLAPRTGVPIFMACMLRSKIYPAGKHDLPPIPAIHSGLHQLYKQRYLERMKWFGQNNTEEEVKIPKGSTLSDSKFEHHLRYDAESVFWVLTWWLIRAKPQDDKRSPHIPHPYWDNLTSEEDSRHDYFISRSQINSDSFHPAYKALYDLWDDMREHLVADFDHSKDEMKKHPEYLHEVFQRLILNFFH